MVSNPFGDPDGSKADLDSSLQRFISFEDTEIASGITTADNERNIRIVVGKKGSGKTLYLRRLQNSARREESVFASKIWADVPSTNAVVAFCQMFSGGSHLAHGASEFVTGAWQSAWRVALINSAFTHLAYKSFFAQYTDQTELRKLHQEILGGKKSLAVERSPYSELKDIIARFKSEQQFWDYISNSKWDDLQTVVGTTLKNCPPIFFYLDASDDEFGQAPMEWHQCQKGLFLAVLRMLGQSGAISSRLHTVIAVREIVYSSAIDGEHRTRYVNSPSICLLDWNHKSISYFLTRKINQVPEKLFFSKNEKTVSSFLGIKKVYNASRRIEEDAETYLLRHTRFLPRDIIQIGNRMSDFNRSERSKCDSEESLQDAVRRLISNMACTFAEEQISICANQLSSHEAPARSALRNFNDFYTSNHEYIKSRSDFIKNYIRLIGRERFDYDLLSKADEVVAADLPVGVRLSTILWQNGLIGLKERQGDPFSFYSLAANAGFILPDHGYQYGFHSIVLDSIRGLAIAKGMPPVMEGGQ